MRPVVGEAQVYQSLLFLCALTTAHAAVTTTNTTVTAATTAPPTPPFTMRAVYQGRVEREEDRAALSPNHP
jgi:hypothetical protein